jgi:5-methylcytosine-specific restriction enzyme subunit McrC
MKNLIQLKEFEPVRGEECQKRGFDEKTICRIESFNRRRGKEVIQILRDGVKATSQVGIFAAGTKTIQILPKIGKEHAEDFTVRNLLYMLAYTRSIDVSEAQISKLCERKRADFFEIIIYLFARNLLELLKKNFHKNYQETQENLNFIKGRILFQEQIKKNLLHKNLIYCNFSLFSEDILLNQIFKYASWLLIGLTRDSENYRMLKEIDFILSDISFKRIKPADFDALHLDRLNYYYRPLVDLARLFILHSTVELTHDKLQTFSFLFDMDELFEQFIASFIIKNKSKVIPCKSDVKYHDRSKYLVDLPKLLFVLEPDITITCNSRKLIIDTKYKVLDPEKPKLGVYPPDMYQCVAYALKHNCSDVVLLYPAHLVKSPNKEPYIVRYDGKEIKVFVRTIDLSIDMQTQKQLIIDELKSVCDCLSLT